MLYLVLIAYMKIDEMNAVIDVSNATLSIANDTVCVPLIQRFSPTNILRTMQSVTVGPLHEVHLPVRISPNYKLCTSLIEPLNTRRKLPILAAKAFVDPSSHVTVYQIVNLSEKPFVIPARMAVATITPAELISEPENLSKNKTASADSAIAEPSFDAKLKVLNEKGFKLKDTDYTPTQFTQLVDLVYEYRTVL